MHHNLPIVARSIHPIEWIERANFLFLNLHNLHVIQKKWRSYEKKTPLFLPFSLFFGENVDFLLCLSIDEIGCAYVVRTYPRTQSFRIDPVRRSREYVPEG